MSRILPSAPKLDRALLAMAILAVVCASLVGVPSSLADPSDPNPPAPGFDASGSDARAIALADRAMEAMGGRAAWDATRFVTWNFFGRRTHLWDKHTGKSRIEMSDENGQRRVLLLDLATKEGSVWVDGQEVTDPEERRKWLDSAEGMWINDGYWLFMPFKLKDSGVTLRHLGPREMQDGRAANVLELTFEAVGRTPQNKYHVFVADETGLVEQWSFFRDAGDSEPQFTTPWTGWTKHGEILLAGDRGEYEIESIAVLETVDPAVFERP